MSMSATTELRIRDRLADGDVEKMIELHRRVYQPEYGMNDTFVDRVGDGIREAHAAGWPERSGAVRLADHDGEVWGCTAMTDEGGGVGRVRWVVLMPELRGTGLGRRLIGEVIDEGRAAGMHTLALETFSALTSAARIYRDAGFRVISELARQDWGQPIVYQHYELRLG
jgi:GNAT superfamily N-acetyltransferase